MAIWDSRVIRISATSVLTGLLIGGVGGAFRLLLIRADDFRNALVAWAHAWPYFGWLAPVALGTLGAVVARLLVVRFAPEAEGSGVQRVEAVYSGEIPPATRDAIVLVKFFGGVLSMGSGLALGREGPTVQMGAKLSSLASRFMLKHRENAEIVEDGRIIEAAGAGAGLAVAFNAPIGGSVFVFEELTSSFTPWLLVGTFAAASFAVFTMRLMLGNHLDFTVQQMPLTAVWRTWPFLVLGALLGGIGALYNSTIIRFVQFSDRFSRVSAINRAAFIGAAIGLIAWFAPAMVGGGDNLTQAVLSGRYGVTALVGIFLLRFLIGPFSYAAGTPGGLFAPMLVLGASFGALIGLILNYFLPTLGITPVACAVVGMATLFTACVRAPLTGIVLTVEMTGRGDLTLTLIGSSLVAMMIAMLVNSEPIYETLKRRTIEQQLTATNKRSGSGQPQETVTLYQPRTRPQ